MPGDVVTPRGWMTSLWGFHRDVAGGAIYLGDASKGDVALVIKCGDECILLTSGRLVRVLDTLWEKHEAG